MNFPIPINDFRFYLNSNFRFVESTKLRGKKKIRLRLNCKESKIHRMFFMRFWSRQSSKISNFFSVFDSWWVRIGKKIQVLIESVQKTRSLTFGRLYNRLKGWSRAQGATPPVRRWISIGGRCSRHRVLFGQQQQQQQEQHRYNVCACADTSEPSASTRGLMDDWVKENLGEQLRGTLVRHPSK